MTAAHRDQDARDAAPVGMYTETLARLYFRQGYAAEALRIYRHLATERPDDPHLQDQIRVLTEQLASTPEPPPHHSGAGSDRTTARPDRSPAAPRLEPVITALEHWLVYLQRRHARR